MLLLATDADPTARMYALRAAGRIKKPVNAETIDVLVGALGRDPPEVECAAADALADIGEDQDEVVEALLRTFRAHRGGSCVVHALASIRPRVAAETDVREWLERNSGYWWAGDALAAMDGPGRDDPPHR